MFNLRRNASYPAKRRKHPTDGRTDPATAAADQVRLTRIRPPPTWCMASASVQSAAPRNVGSALAVARLAGWRAVHAMADARGLRRAAGLTQGAAARLRGGGRFRRHRSQNVVADSLVFECLCAYNGLMSDAARWNLIVSRATDDALRQFLASQGRGRKGELSRFVEEAVQARIFELTAEQAKQQNAHLSAEEITEIVDEALGWARRA